MSTLQTFKDPSGEVIYPATHAKATLIERGEDAITLEDYIEEIDDTLDTCVKKDFISAEVFDATKAYTRSELVWYENKLYIFTHSKTAGAWDSSKVQEITDLGSTFQTQNLRTPLLVGGLVHGDLEGALGDINSIANNNSDRIDTLNTNVSNLTTSKQDKLTAGTNISFNNNTINATYPIAVNKFDKANLYSTTEKVVGCWTDGKPLYQKTIVDTMPAAVNTTKDISIGNNIEICFIVGAFVKASAGALQPLPCIAPVMTTTYSFNGIMLFGNSGSPSNSIRLGTNIAIAVSAPVYITIQYTKTTDSANSFKHADENNYSTTEHIVGTWIDGKPVYQKTIDFGTLPNSTVKSVSHGISNMNKFIKISGVWFDANNGWDINWSSHSTIAHQINAKVTKSNISITTASNYSAYSAYITIQYTKTTD